jgi:hypothetical protein
VHVYVHRGECLYVYEYLRIYYMFSQKNPKISIFIFHFANLLDFTNWGHNFATPMSCTKQRKGVIGKRCLTTSEEFPP